MKNCSGGKATCSSALLELEEEEFEVMTGAASVDDIVSGADEELRRPTVQITV